MGAAAAAAPVPGPRDLRAERYSRVMAAAAAAAPAARLPHSRGRGAVALGSVAEGSAESWESQSQDDGVGGGGSGGESGGESSDDGRPAGVADAFVLPPTAALPATASLLLPGAAAAAGAAAVVAPSFVPGSTLPDGTRVPPKVSFSRRRPGLVFIVLLHISRSCWCSSAPSVGGLRKSRFLQCVTSDAGHDISQLIIIHALSLSPVSLQPAAPSASTAGSSAPEAAHRAEPSDSDAEPEVVPTRRSSQRLPQAPPQPPAAAVVAAAARGRPRGSGAAAPQNPLIGVEGALLPLPVRMSNVRVAWVHANCAAFSPLAAFRATEDTEEGDAVASPEVQAVLRGTWTNIAREVRWKKAIPPSGPSDSNRFLQVRRGGTMRCSHRNCRQRRGATIGCSEPSCGKSFHLRCAICEGYAGWRGSAAEGRPAGADYRALRNAAIAVTLVTTGSASGATSVPFAPFYCR